MSKRPWSVGSQWHRWDPHIHAPGTLLEDHFGGDWAAYFAAIESATPQVVALGITDYFTLRTYKEFRSLRLPTSCPSVRLVFANIELRLKLPTKAGGGVNLHLLVSPEDDDHVSRMEEALGRLTYSFRGDLYPCNDDGLKRLGRAQAGAGKMPDEAAREAGANQFKVDLDQLRGLFADSLWLRENVVVGVAAGNDGLSGLSKNSSFSTLREELGRFADFIFSAQPSEREYWLGQHPGFDKDQQMTKPCLHGSDAHEIARVLRPDFDRRLWLKGDPTFETLRQTLVEPDRRVHIGADAPTGAQTDEVITSVHANPATWLSTPDVQFNSGLVTIIGAKGSGKTALADLVALATGAGEDEPGPASFMKKARSRLGPLVVEARWSDGTIQTGSLEAWEDDPYPRVLYLSQQFVERLSSPEGLTEPLVEEIERVVFGAIPFEDRLETAGFSELRDVVLESPRSARSFEQGAVLSLTQTVAAEQGVLKSLPDRKKALDEATRARDGLEREIAAIPVKAGDEKAKEHHAAALAVQTLTELVAKAERRTLDLKEVSADAHRIVATADAQWRALRDRYPGLLADDVWDLLRPSLAARAPTVIAATEVESRRLALSLRRTGKPDPSSADQAIAETAEGLQALIAGRDKLATELGLDVANARRKVESEAKLVTLKASETKAQEAVKHAEGSHARIKDAQRERLAAYQRVFESLDDEQAVLAGLYGPLSNRVRSDDRLSKWSVTVRRVADIAAWATRGEQLFDLRSAPFGGRGTLAKAATANLALPWTSGSPEDVRAAMHSFYEANVGTALANLAQGVTPLDVGNWFFSTQHITVRYGIDYEGVDLSLLSPGTRGVVLLTLYLALDRWDARPLLIDQPEENLDPSSVYDDLVPFFREATERRQIIMVTHNANLVVNTDSDQVIVASAHRETTDALPQITYEAGGLEDPYIRAAICRLLEGGEIAFRKRRIRYGLK